MGNVNLAWNFSPNTYLNKNNCMTHCKTNWLICEKGLSKTCLMSDYYVINLLFKVKYLFDDHLSLQTWCYLKSQSSMRLSKNRDCESIFILSLFFFCNLDENKVINLEWNSLQKLRPCSFIKLWHLSIFWWL